MKTQAVVQLSLLLLLQVLFKTPVFAQQSRSQDYTFHSGMQGIVYAPAGRAANDLTFVDLMDYMPGTDDDAGFNIAHRGNGAYSVKVVDGNSRSHINFRLSTWELPDYVGFERHMITLKGKNDSESLRMLVPEGCKAIALIELLTYWPDTDDDYGYAVRAFGAEPYLIVTAVSDFGTSSSQLHLRVTMLYWPADVQVEFYDPARLVATMKGGQRVTIPQGYLSFATPTAYVSDASKYKYEDFDRLLAAIYNQSFAGKPPVDIFGYVENVGNVAKGVAQAVSGAITPQDAIKLAKDVATLLKTSITMGGPDDRDDDFWLETTSSSNSIGVRIGDGNKFSMAEVTVWMFAFPPSQ